MGTNPNQIPKRFYIDETLAHIIIDLVQSEFRRTDTLNCKGFSQTGQVTSRSNKTLHHQVKQSAVSLMIRRENRIIQNFY